MYIRFKLEAQYGHLFHPSLGSTLLNSLHDRLSTTSSRHTLRLSPLILQLGIEQVPTARVGDVVSCKTNALASCCLIEYLLP